MAYASNIEIFGQNYAIKDSRLTDFFIKTKKDLYFQNPRFLIFDFSDANRKSVKIRKGTYIDLPITSGGITTVRTLYADSDTAFDLSAKITAAAAASGVRTGEENGKDFYVYLVPDGENGIDLTVSERKDYPGDIDAGYTADNTRRIGQFHTLCVDADDEQHPLTAALAASPGSLAAGDTCLVKRYKDDGTGFHSFYSRSVVSVTAGAQYDTVTVSHPLAGFRAGDVLPESVFCLSFRPFSGAEGMVYDPDTDRIPDIYLQSGKGLLTRSEFGATITDTRQQQNHQDDMMRVGKRLLYDYEFSSAAAGSNEKTNIYGAADPVTTGGHKDTAGRRMLSFIGCEDMCGVMWQWLEENACNGGSSWETYDGHASFGQMYGASYALLAGGSWSNSSTSGSRARNGNYARSTVFAFVGGRGASRLISSI